MDACNNFVAEIAQMQTLIVKYELAIKSLYFIVKHDCNINYPEIGERTVISKQLSYIWKWVKEHKDKNIK